MGSCASTPVVPTPVGKQRSQSSRSLFSSCTFYSYKAENCNITLKSSESVTDSDRIISSGSLTHCSISSAQGGKGLNQDSIIAWEKFHGIEEATFCGVFDGHGPHGHIISRHVRDSLPNRLGGTIKTFLKPSAEPISPTNQDPQAINSASAVSQQSVNDSETSYSKERDETEDVTGQFKEDSAAREISPLYEKIAKDKRIKAFCESFKYVDDDIRHTNKVIPKYSGSTAVIAFMHETELTVANLGDSRCVLGSLDSRGSIVATQITQEQTPSDLDERQRIESRGGRVMPMRMSPGILRVWLPNEDTPGLAMTRAFGDLLLKKYGVSNVPSIHYTQISSSDKFLILATDGVWDVMSNEEAVQVVFNASPNNSADELVKAARNKWQQLYRPSQIDDASVAIIHFTLLERTMPPQLPIALNESVDSVDNKLWNWKGHAA